MIGKMMMTAALALTVALPAVAQTPQTYPGQTMPPDNGMMDNSTMGNGMGTMTTPKMSKSEMSAMKKCQAMSSDAMAKSSRCTKLMQKYPQGGTSPM